MKYLLTILLSGLVGAVATAAVIKYKPGLINSVSNSSHPVAEKPLSFFKDDFFSAEDPFKEMKEMQERMISKFGLNSFDSFFTVKDFSNMETTDITTKEDDHYLYYEIGVHNLDKTSVNTKVENGNITISGKITKTSDSDEESSELHSTYTSTFHKSFPLPNYVDDTRMESYAENNKLIVKFPKISST